MRLRAKKGPRRLNKQRQQAKQPPKKKTAEELDREMEEYKARAEGKGGKDEGKEAEEMSYRASHGAIIEEYFLNRQGTFLVDVRDMRQVPIFKNETRID